VSRLSLRARLVLGVILLAGLGLAAADVATYSSLSSFLIGRTDTALQDAHLSVSRARGGPDDHGHGGGPPGEGRPGGIANAAPGDYVQIRKLDGTIITTHAARDFPGTEDDPAPKLPKSLNLPSARDGGDRVAYFTADAVRGHERYRVRASIEANDPSHVVLLAAPLEDVDGTLHRLLLIELLVTGLVLAGIALLGLYVIRLGLKPLRAIEATAASIAAGDLSQRVEHADERTEVGRLGLALNAMLAHIESAFKAREASERKLRQFVADASHELRTPLAAVRAYAELFGRGAAERPDDLARSMTGIRRESERMTLLVDDLLLLARLDEGPPLEREPVELGAVISEAVETARTLDPTRTIELAIEPARVVGDRDRLRQIIDNLLSNARAHTPPGTHVHVSLKRSNGSAHLTVADDGPGMTHDQVAHVFERFYRTDASRTRASGGVGLGLSIVAAVAEAHGGAVSAESVPGSGTRFNVELPSTR
jgi:two-component system, OmpR family, sensor kinase